MKIWGYLALLLVFASCRPSIPTQELEGFRARTNEWATIIQSTEANFGGISERHESFIGLLSDTTSYQRQQKIQSDSTLRFQIAQLEGNYEKLHQNHVYDLKLLRIWMEESKSWISQVNFSGLSTINANKSWASRQARFLLLKSKADESAAVFEELGPAYQSIRASILL